MKTLITFLLTCCTALEVIGAGPITPPAPYSTPWIQTNLFRATNQFDFLVKAGVVSLVTNQVIVSGDTNEPSYNGTYIWGGSVTVTRPGMWTNAFGAFTNAAGWLVYLPNGAMPGTGPVIVTNEAFTVGEPGAVRWGQDQPSITCNAWYQTVGTNQWSWSRSPMVSTYPTNNNLLTNLPPYVLTNGQSGVSLTGLFASTTTNWTCVSNLLVDFSLCSAWNQIDVLTNNITFTFTNMSPRRSVTIYLQGGTTNYTVTYVWPAGSKATWLTATNSGVTSNKVGVFRAECRTTTNAPCAYKEEL